jgi:hypothetical protein
MRHRILGSRLGYVTLMHTTDSSPTKLFCGTTPAPSEVVLEALPNSFYFRRHVRKAAYSVGCVATLENPDFVIRLRTLHVPHGTERFVTGNALHAYLCREHVPWRFPCGLGRSSENANHRTVKNQNGNDRQVAGTRIP